MKKLAIAMIAAFAALSPTASIAQQGPFGRVDYEVIFLDEIYQEVGRWTYYCSGYISEEDMITHRTINNYYGCD